jgi:hypothetical protein
VIKPKYEAQPNNVRRRHTLPPLSVITLAFAGLGTCSSLRRNMRASLPAGSMFLNLMCDSGAAMSQELDPKTVDLD